MRGLRGLLLSLFGAMAVVILGASVAQADIYWTDQGTGEGTGSVGSATNAGTGKTSLFTGQY